MVIVSIVMTKSDSIDIQNLSNVNEISFTDVCLFWQIYFIIFGLRNLIK